VLSFGRFDPHQVRMALIALFAVMVEMCATLGLFVDLRVSGIPEKS
jgi:hypothetical protein